MKDSERNYHELKGALLSLNLTDWSKALLLRDLDQLYEELLRYAETAGEKAKSETTGDASTASSIMPSGSSTGKDSTENSW